MPQFTYRTQTIKNKSESSSSPASDNKDDFRESITVSTTNDSIETESPELEEVNESNRVNGETTGEC